MKTARIDVRLTETLKAALRKHCKAKGISMTDFIEALLSKSLKRN